MDRTLWLIQSVDDSPLFSLPVPDSLDILDGLEDRVLTRTVDSLGVESLQIWRIRESG